MISVLFEEDDEEVLSDDDQSESIVVGDSRRSTSDSNSQATQLRHFSAGGDPASLRGNGMVFKYRNCFIAKLLYCSNTLTLF